ncbi:MAG: acyl-CoA/acyl-ACP dehydrogenase [Chloroflexota bacterium]|nr:acyl-CoA/acyl-ACP dehydrogenase [Chloroflexota bacterium]
MVSSPRSAAHDQGLVERIANLARENFAPRAAVFDSESSFPFDNYRDLHQADLIGLTVPREYGGLGVDPVTYVLALLEMAKGCPATALTFNMHANVIININQLASPEQKRRYFGEVVEKGKLFATVMSEPESSFRDLFVLRTRFTPTNLGKFRVQGLKHFCSLGDAADRYFVTGLREGSATAEEGIMAALVPRSDEGITLERPWNATGMRATTSHSIRFDTEVSSEDILGDPGQLLTIELSGFALGYAATYLGVAEAAYDFILDYARKRVIAPATESLAHDTRIQRNLGEMAAQVRAAKLMLCEAAAIRATGVREDMSLATNQAKYLCAEAGVRVTEQAMRLAGGSGFLKTMPLERWHRDALAGPVMPPSNDRCLEVIGRIVCGLRTATLEFQ